MQHIIQHIVQFRYCTNENIYKKQKTKEYTVYSKNFVYNAGDNMNSRERNILNDLYEKFGDMHGTVKAIDKKVTTMNGTLIKTNERSIKNEVKLNGIWKLASILTIMLTTLLNGAFWFYDKIKWR